MSSTEYGQSEWFMSSKFQGQSKIGFAKTLFWSLLRVQLFAWSLDKNAAAIGGASKPLSTVFSVVYPIWKVAAAVAVVEIEAAVIEVAAVGLVEMVAGMETAVD